MTSDPAFRQVFGVMLAVLSALAYAGTNVLIRRGSRPGLSDHGLLLTLVVNVVVLFPVAVVAGLRLHGHAPVRGVLFFGLSGLCAGFLGRLSLFAGINRIGSSRTSSLKNLAPGVALVAGIVLLGERLAPTAWVGVALCLGGLTILLRERQPVAPEARSGLLVVVEATPDSAGTMTTSPDGLGGTGAEKATSRAGRTSLIGIGCGLGAALAFGLAQLARKVGVGALPDPLLGALVGVVTSLVAYLGLLGVRRRLADVVRSTRRHANLSLVAAGLTSVVGMLSFLLALKVLPVSVASVISSAEVMFTLVLAALVLRRQELVTRTLALAGLLVCAGAVVLSSS